MADGMLCVESVHVERRFSKVVRRDRVRKSQKREEGARPVSLAPIELLVSLGQRSGLGLWFHGTALGQVQTCKGF